MDVCFAINNGYTDYCRVAMVSLLENNRDTIVNFHILTDFLLPENERKLKETARKYNATLTVYNFDNKRFYGLNNSWSIYAWYRVIAHEYLPNTVSKLLYLDCDVIVMDALSELMSIDMSDKALAAVTDFLDIFPGTGPRLGYESEKGYFCSGVLLMNLDYFRAHDLGNKILDYARTNAEKINFPDQDTLNIVCQDCKVTLPLKYGILRPFFTDSRFIDKYRSQVIDAFQSPKIIHYAGCAPWIIESQPHFFEDEFWIYASKVGGIKPRHCCVGMALLKLRIKQILGVLRIPGFMNYRREKKLTRKDVRKKLNI